MNEKLHENIDKNYLYKQTIKQMESLIDPTLPLVTNLSNASALLNEVLEDINWVGFYLLKEEILLLGPFQGKVACTKIALGKGVCGTAAKEARTQVVEDVHQFPGHIACDSASNSEIVVPIIIDNKVVGVLDIDSPNFSRFDEQDKEGLETIIEVVEKQCDWSVRIV
ncbi:MAG: GAF domain-containing protein [Candidatus Galacturonibacter soehngenii]|nr:GAF domain-containing protein [Candidatus Galacturonibacter soehngenii]